MPFLRAKRQKLFSADFTTYVSGGVPVLSGGLILQRTSSATVQTSDQTLNTSEWGSIPYSLTFDGTTRYGKATAVPFASASQVTLLCWVKQNPVATYKVLLSTNANELINDAFALYQNPLNLSTLNTQLGFIVYDHTHGLSSAVYSSTPLELGTGWVRVCATIDQSVSSGQTNLYLNGVKQTSRGADQNCTAGIATGDLWVASRNGGGPFPSANFIINKIIIGKAFTPQEAADDYFNGRTASGGTLLANYAWNEGSGTTIVDTGTGAKNIALTSPVWSIDVPSVPTGILSNVARIGQRTASSSSRGLVIEEGRINKFIYAHDLNNSNLTAGAGITVFMSLSSPDSTTNAVRLSSSAGSAYSKYYSQTVAASGAYVSSIWTKFTGSGPAAGRFQAGAQMNPDYTSTSLTYGIASASWSRQYGKAKIVPNIEALAMFSCVTYLPTLYGEIDPWSGDVTRDSIVDFLQVESGSFSTEVILTSGSFGSRAPERLYHAYGGSAFTPNGRISFETRFIPKGSSNQYYSPMYLWYIDDTHYARIETTGLISVVSGASTNTSTGSIAWNQYDTVDMFIAAGGSAPSQMWYRLNDDIVQKISVAGAALGSFTTTKSIDLFCSGTAGQLSSWIQTLNFWNAGYAPNWVSPVIWGTDFTTFPTGGIATLPNDLNLSRASAATVQTSHQTVVHTASIGNNVARIGQRLAATSSRGLVLEETRTNLITYSQGLDNASWNPVVGTIVKSASVSIPLAPDGTQTAGTLNWAAEAGTGDSIVRNIFVIGPGNQAVFSSNIQFISGTNLLYQDFGDEAGNIYGGNLNVTSGTFERYQRTHITGPSNYVDLSPKSASLHISPAAKFALWGLQVETNKFWASEYIPTSGSTGTRAGERLYHATASNVVSNGRIGFNTRFIGKGTRNQYTSNMYLWNLDSQNYCLINVSGTITSSVGGILNTTNETIDWNQYDTVDIWAESGNGLSVFKYKTNLTGAIFTFSVAGNTQPFINTATTSTLDLYCSGTSGQLSAWIQGISFYRYGTKPNWVYNADPITGYDFRTVSTGALTTPSLFTFNRSSPATVQTSDQTVITSEWNPIPYSLTFSTSSLSYGNYGKATAVPFAGATQMTILGWIKLQQTSSTQVWLESSAIANTSNAFALYQGAAGIYNALSFYTRDQSLARVSESTSTANLVTGSWYRFCAVIDRTKTSEQATLYINGLSGSNTYGNSNCVAGIDTNDLYFGARGGTSIYATGSLIVDKIIVSKSYTPYEAADDYFNGRMAVGGTVLASYSWTSGSTITDSGTGAKNIVLTNTPIWSTNVPTVVSGIIANTPRVGQRTASTSTRGLVIEETRTNLVKQSHNLMATGSGWVTATATTASGITSPDSSSLAVWTQAAAGSTVGVNQFNASLLTISASYNASYWTRAHQTGDRDTQGVLISFGGNGAVIQTTASNVWTRYSTGSVATSAVFSVDMVDGRAVGGLTAANHSIETDMVQFENGIFATELIVTNTASLARAGERLSVATASNVISRGRLSLETRLIPKASSSQYSAPMYLWYMDETHYARIENTGSLTIVSGSASLRSASGSISFNQYEPLDIFACIGGNVSSSIWIRKNDSILQNIPVTGTIGILSASNGTIDLFCSGTAGQFSSWVQYINFWTDGSSPTWAKRETLWDADFTTQTPGIASNLYGFSLQRNSVATVQTSTSSVLTTGITNNVARIGYDGFARGLVIEESRTNLAIDSYTTGSSWAAGPGTYTWDKTYLSPDGTNSASSLTDTDVSNNVFILLGIPVVVSQSYSYTSWLKDLGASSNPVMGINVNDHVPSGLIFNRPWNNTNWGKISSIDYVINGAYGNGLALIPAYSAPANTGSAAFWGQQKELGKFATELIHTTGSTATRAGERLYRSIGTDCIDNGRLSLEFNFYPKGHSGSYSSHMTLWTDSNNTGSYIQINSGSLVLTCSVNGVIQTTNPIGGWASGSFIKLFVAMGGNYPTIAQYQLSSSSPVNLGVTGSTFGNITVTGSAEYLCAGTGSQMSAWVSKITAYKFGSTPSWVIVNN